MSHSSNSSAKIALDPGKRVLLADREDDVVARDHDRVDDCGVARLLIPFEALKLHADEHAVLDDECVRSMVDDDLDTLLLGVLLLPRRGLEVRPRAARHDLDVGAAEAQRRAAAVHRRVAAADDEDALADLVDVAERDDSSQSMPIWMRSLSRRPGMSRSLPRGAPLPTKTASKSSLEQRSEAANRRVRSRRSTPMSMMVAISSSRTSSGQAELRDIGAHQAARLAGLLEDDAVVAERQRGRGRRSARPARRRCRRSACRSCSSGITGRRSAMSPRRSAATRFRRQIATGVPSIPAAPAGGLAGAVAGAPEDARKHVRLPVEHVRVGVAALSDQADVFGDVGVGRAGPLAIDDPMEIVRVRRVGWVHEMTWVPGLGPCSLTW